jgi:hypothetical protein
MRSTRNWPYRASAAPQRGSAVLRIARSRARGGLASGAGGHRSDTPASWGDSGGAEWVGFIGFRVEQRCVDVLPKLLWCAHWRLGAGLVDLGPKEG